MSCRALWALVQQELSRVWNYDVDILESSVTRDQSHVKDEKKEGGMVRNQEKPLAFQMANNKMSVCVCGGCPL